jgi:hypothetical protein
MGIREDPEPPKNNIPGKCPVFKGEVVFTKKAGRSHLIRAIFNNKK